MSTSDLLTQIKELQSVVAHLVVKDQITELLNSYGYTLDLGDFDAYEANFTENCTAVMSFSTHNGRKDLGKWMAEALKDTDRGVHLSSNFELTLDVPEGGTAADCLLVKARTKLHAACHFKGGELSDCLTLGGLYAWELVRKSRGEKWLIQRCEFEPYWSRGNRALLASKE